MPHMNRPNSTRRRRILLFAGGFTVIIASALGAALGTVAVFEYSQGGLPRVKYFMSGQLQQDRIRRGDSHGPEGFVLTFGFTAGALLGLWLWRRVGTRALGISQREVDDSLH